MAQEIFYEDINLMFQQILNASLQNLGTYPAQTSPDGVQMIPGFLFWHTVDKAAYIWSGTQWINFTQVYTHPSYPGGPYPATPQIGAWVPSQIQVANGHISDVIWRQLTAADIGAATTSHTHNYANINGLPPLTILGNNTQNPGQAVAMTVADLMAMMAISYGDYAALLVGTATNYSTWSAKQLNDYITARLNAYVVTVNLNYVAEPTKGTITNSAGTGATIPAGSTVNASLMLPSDKSKLDGIALNANNYTHPLYGPSSNPFATELLNGLYVLSQMVINNEGHVTQIKGRNITVADLAAVLINDAINNGTLTTWSSSKIHAEILDAIDTAQTGALSYKGGYNATTNTPNLVADPLIKTGYIYVVSGSGSFAGQNVESGDMIIAVTNNPGSTADNWQIVNRNIDAIVDATTTVKGIIQLATMTDYLNSDGTKAVTSSLLRAVLDERFGDYTVVFGDNSSTSFAFIHNLNTKTPVIDIIRVSDDQYVRMQRKSTSLNIVTVDCNIAPTAGQFRVRIKK